MAKNLPERLMVRSGTYYCRIWVPKDVAAVFGRQLVVTCLRTKDLKTAKPRLARKSIELEDRFDMIRAEHFAASRPDALQPDPKPLRARFVEIARQHAIDASDREFASRAEIFRESNEAPARLWSGELTPLPTPADFGQGEEDAYTYFDHLTAEGDLERVIAFLARFRLKQRLEALQRKRASGNLAEWIALARDKIRASAISTPWPWRDCSSTKRFWRCAPSSRANPILRYSSFVPTTRLPTRGSGRWRWRAQLPCPPRRKSRFRWTSCLPAGKPKPTRAPARCPAGAASPAT